MGVSVPDLPAPKTEDNINLGDKDSIRRRALWALEGKPDVSYSKVEIPELASPQTENPGFNFRELFSVLHYDRILKPKYSEQTILPSWNWSWIWQWFEYPYREA